MQDNSKNTTNVLLAIIAVLLVSILVYLFISNSKTKEEVSYGDTSTDQTDSNSYTNPLTNPIATSTPQTTPTPPIDVSNYQGNGFTAKYPYPSSYVKTSAPSAYFDLHTTQTAFSDGDCVSSECSTQFMVYIKDPVANQQDLDSFVRTKFLNNIPSNMNITVQTTPRTVGGKPGTQYSYQQFAGGYNGTTYIVAVLHNGKGYIIQHVNSTVVSYQAFVNSFTFTQ